MIHSKFYPFNRCLIKVYYYAYLSAQRDYKHLPFLFACEGGQLRLGRCIHHGLVRCGALLYCYVCDVWRELPSPPINLLLRSRHQRRITSHFPLTARFPAPRLSSSYAVEVFARVGSLRFTLNIHIEAVTQCVQT